jgi:hypothetical protein
MENGRHFICCCTEHFDKNLAERNVHENLADEKKAQIIQ